MRRVLILLVVLVVLGVGGYFLYTTVIAPPAPTPGGTNGAPAPTEGPTATPISFTPVLVAVQELPRGIKVPEGAVEVRQWPSASVPQTALSDPKDAIGKIVRTTIYVEQPVTSDLLVDDLTKIAASGSDAAAVMPAGLVAVSIPVDRLTDVAYAVQDGDYVDVIVSFLFVDVDTDFQTIQPNKLSIVSVKDGVPSFIESPPGREVTTSFGPGIASISEPEQRPRLVTQRTIQGAFVVHAGLFPPDGKFIGKPPTPTPVPVNAESNTPTPGAPPPTPTPAYPDTVTLAVSPQEAVVLVWFLESRIPMTLALRAAKDQGAPVPSDAVTLRYIIDNYKIQPPPKLPYALEPALRSIRQLNIGSSVSLVGGAAPTP